MEELKTLLYKKVGLILEERELPSEVREAMRPRGGVKSFAEVQRKLKMKILQRKREQKEKAKAETKGAA